jgi:SNF2 family DNA or RNA helicase
VAADTIEEKIVKLHGLKRDLADSLLEGTDSTGRMSAQQLLELIKEV